VECPQLIPVTFKICFSTLFPLKALNSLILLSTKPERAMAGKKMKKEKGKTPFFSISFAFFSAHVQQSRGLLNPSFPHSLGHVRASTTAASLCSSIKRLPRNFFPGSLFLKQKTF